MPSTWKRYGVDANHDGRKDPYNPVDAIFAAARYLKAAGADQDIRRAIFAYNHADWYVDSVLMRARLIGGLPADLVGSLTGLTQGHFPVHAKARYADDIDDAATPRSASRRARTPRSRSTSSSTRRGINIFAKAGSPVDRRPGRQDRQDGPHRAPRQLHPAARRLRQHLHLRAPEEARRRLPGAEARDGLAQAQVDKELELAPRRTPSRPRPPAPARRSRPTPPPAATARPAGRRPPRRRPRRGRARSACSPTRTARAPTSAGGEEQLLNAGSVDPGLHDLQVLLHRRSSASSATTSCSSASSSAPRSSPARSSAASARTEQKMAPHMLFEIRPAGRGAPRIDPKPILDGWKLLESTAIYRAAGKNPFFGPDAKNPSIGQILLMSKEALQHRVLTDPRIEIYDCGRRDIQAGDIDRRVLATLEFLAASGLKPTVTSLHCGHGYLTDLGQRLRALVGQRRRHRRDQRHPDPRPPGPGLDHRHHDPPPADPAGHDEAPPDHQPDDLRRRRQHARAARPRRPHPRRLPARSYGTERQARPPARRGPQARASGSSSSTASGKIDNPTVPTQAVEVRAQGAAKRASKAHARRHEPPLRLRPARVPLGARARPTAATSCAGTPASPSTCSWSPRSARPSAGCCGGRRPRPRRARAAARAGRHRARDAHRRRSPSPTTTAAERWLRTRRRRGRGRRPRSPSLNRVLHVHRVADRRPARARGAPRAGARRPRRLRRGRAGRRRALGRGARAARAARRAPRATPRCARRSASRRCSAAATPRWPARSWRCARAGPRRRAPPRGRAAAARRARGRAGRARAVGAARRPRGAPRASCASCAAASRAAAHAALQGGLEDDDGGRRRARARPPRGRAARAHGARFRLTVHPLTADLAVRAGAGAPAAGVVCRAPGH